jgi:hypothetical protein
VVTILRVVTAYLIGACFGVAAATACGDTLYELNEKLLDESPASAGGGLTFGEAARDPIETDRHDFTQSPRVLDVGMVQIESGYTFFYKDRNEEIETSHTLPEMLVRVGIAEGLEFRVRWNYAWTFRESEEEVTDEDGAEDIRWGLKLQVTEECGGRPVSALRLESTVPTGGDAFSTDRMEFGLDYVYAWDIVEGLNLAASTGFYTNGAGEFSFGGSEGLEGTGEDRFLAYAQSVALGIELTDSSELYLEYYGIWTDGLADERVLNFFNAGVDYLVTDDFVLDVRAGVGLSDEADDFFIGVGGGYRF